MSMLPEQKNASLVSLILEKGPIHLLFVLTFLLPLFFLPVPSVTFAWSKQILLVTLVLVSFVLWVANSFKTGKVSFPADSSQIFLGLFLLAALASSFLATFPLKSLFGFGPELDTLGSLFIFSLLFFLIPIYFNNKKNIFHLFIAFFVSFALVGIFHLVRLAFGPSLFSLDIFTNPTSNFIGKWNDLGVYAGIMTILSLSLIEFLSTFNRLRTFAYIIFGASLILVFIVNFPLLWLVLALVALALFLMRVFLVAEKGNADSVSTNPTFLPKLKMVMKQMSHGVSFCWLPVFLFVFALVCFFSNLSIGTGLAKYTGISALEARPALSLTYDIARSAVTKNPLFGTGPNTFVNQWLLSKPAPVNQTLFWNSDFLYGFGLILSFPVTIGLVGFFMVILFILFFVKRGIFSLRTLPADPLSRYFVLSTLLASLYLWALNIFYVPNIATFALSFIIAGLFVGALVSANVIANKELEFAKYGLVGFLVRVVLLALVLASLFLGFTYVKKFVADVSFQKGVVLVNTTGNLDEGEMLILKAAEATSQDVYYQALTSIGILRINQMLSSKEKVEPEVIQKKFKDNFDKTLVYVTRAIQIDQNNYKNWTALGNLYFTLVPLKIPNSYENAMGAYQKALLLNPQNPSFPLVLGRLEVAHDNPTGARDYIAKALALKSNYLDAYILRGQLNAEKGDKDATIADFEAAAIISQTDPVIFFQLGTLYYDAKKYENAAGVLERSVSLAPNYSNARYFLGLTYEKLNRTSEALVQFTEVQRLNPDNKEIAEIVKNVKAGKSSFSKPVTTTAEKPTTKLEAN